MMRPVITNIDTEEYATGKASTGGTYRYLDLSGTNIGVRVEEIEPSDTSSVAHFHTLEEEHVIVLSGKASLEYGGDLFELSSGDHVCFAAGEEVAHRIINTSDEVFRFLVFGERRPGDVVIYPEQNKVLIKALGKSIQLSPGNKQDGDGL